MSVIIVSLIAVAVAGYYYVANRSAKTAGTVGGIGSTVGGNGQNRTVTVSTVLAQQRDYPVRLSANGVVSAVSMVDIRAQVSSTIAKVHIKEGQFVRAGEVLFTLDSRADEVNLAKAQAQLEKDLATMADNQRQLARSKELLEKKFVSQSALDASQTLVQAQQAVLASDKAAITAARVALSYNRIVAPSAGRTGIISVYPGSLVQANSTAAPLVTITQMDPVAVTFPLPQRNLPEVLASMHGNSGTKENDQVVMAVLPDSSKQFKGQLQFVDNLVDAATGTVKVKALFDNKEMKLWPGAYVNVALSVNTLKDAIVVPQDAIIIGVKGQSVYIVDVDNKATMQPVTVLHTAGTDAVVKGIRAGVKVIVEGKQNLRPGVPVKERNAGSADVVNSGAVNKDAVNKVLTSKAASAS
ncbi:efflux RND transporter periplasmic adaptor subunit [soil metagenome]